MDGDLRGPPRKALAGPQQERDARPSPGVQVHAEGRERLRAGAGGHALFLPVAGDFRSFHDSFLVLARTVSVATREPVMGAMDFRTFTFSSWMLSGSRSTGGSMATRERSCSMWFCIMSRSAPALS